MAFQCTCPTCAGAGRITCPDCEGGGARRYDLLALKPGDLRDLTPHGRKKIIELQAAARDVTRQCAELQQLMPRNAGKYDQQHQAIMADLEEQGHRIQRAERA